MPKEIFLLYRFVFDTHDQFFAILIKYKFLSTLLSFFKKIHIYIGKIKSMLIRSLRSSKEISLLAVVIDEDKTQESYEKEREKKRELSFIKYIN